MAGDIVSVMKTLYQTMLDKIEIDTQRAGNPNWQLTSMHVMSQEQFAMVTSPDTPTEIKCLVYISSFAGNQWIRVENGEESVPPQVYIDSPISDWELDTNEP